MNSETFVQLMHNGFRVTLGATASFIEVLQDPEKREENLVKLRQEWSKLSDEWIVKGESTEQEARKFVETMLNRQSTTTTTTTSPAASPTGTTSTTTPDVQTELQELTAQIASIRAELEQIRNAQ